MNASEKRVPGRSQRLTLAKLTPPDWFGWIGVSAMFLLMAVRLETPTGVWFFPLLSLGEWLLLPLGVASLTMGFLSLSRIKEKTLLPLWIAAIVPAVLWLAAIGLAILNSGVSPASGDMFLSWLVHLIFPAMAFLPLLTMRVWRDRLMWALAAGLAVNAVAIFIMGRLSGLGQADTGLLRIGGFLANQHDFGLMAALVLPLIAAWRGGDHLGKNRAFVIMLTTFLLPALVLSACYTWMGLVAASAGLLVAWAAWRSHAWILGIFLGLLIFGYNGENRAAQDADKRSLITASASMGGPAYTRALNTFGVRPFFGSGPETFCIGDGHSPTDTYLCSPWYAALLGGSGLVGLGMWMVLLAELAARSMGRFGRRCLWHGGVLGSVAALALAGFWTDGLPEGAGAVVGILLALSILEEPEGHQQHTRIIPKN
ncbi:MAG: hypothetical protein LUC93_01180 [Planctomycetaceae bacterium]|nr:hypothetical protein [Planctomycetaceae bacterium]